MTPLGIELLAEMERLGIALDLSHLTPRGCEVALERLRRQRLRLARQRPRGGAQSRAT